MSQHQGGESLGHRVPKGSSSLASFRDRGCLPCGEWTWRVVPQSMETRQAPYGSKSDGYSDYV